MAELNRIFSQPLFVGSMDDVEERGYLKPGPHQIRDDRFWIPLMLLLSGARSSEIVGLGSEEVFIDCATPHFVLDFTEVRRLKNAPSRRLVPIHSYLIKLGFLDFVAERKKGGGRLFPMAEQEFYLNRRTGVREPKSLSNSTIMRQFNRTVLANADAKKDGGSIKCFRNNFEAEAALKISDEEKRLRLTGRAIPNTSRYYKDHIIRDEAQRDETLLGLKAAMDLMTFDKLDLSRIKRPSGQN
jgi:integrase